MQFLKLFPAQKQAYAPLAGLHLCAAYGYDMRNGQLQINESEAEIVKKIYSLYLQGYGIQAIADKLTADDVPTSTGKTIWYPRTIAYILTNERYIGDALLQKKYMTDTLPRKYKRNKGERQQYYVEHDHPPIISREMFTAVAERLKANRIENRQRHSFPMTGKIYCPECGSRFRRQELDGKIYWLCGGRARGRSACTSRRVRENMVYDAFLRMADKLADNRQYLLGTLISQIEQLRERTSQNTEVIRQIDRELADLAARNLVITRLHTAGVLTAADYTAQADEIGNRITELRIQRRKKLSEDEDDELLDDLRSLDEIMGEYIPTTTFDEELFSQIVERLTVEDNATVTFKLIGGIELTEEITERGRCKTS